MRRLVLALMVAGIAGQGLAEAPQSSPRPQPRPVEAVPLSQVAAGPATLPAPQPAVAPALTAPSLPLVRPRPRPQILPVSTPVAEPEAAQLPETPRKRGLFGRQREAAPATDNGFICGDRRVKGEKLARIKGPVKGCGVEAPVRVTSVSGVRLSQPATLDCGTAVALRTWVDRALQPRYSRSKVVQLQVAAHYICRSRNNQRGAKISEHGRGKAIDISGFVLANGREVSVRNDWRGSGGAPLRKAYKGACGIFGTTLGPGSDGFHEDHMHFDTARQRNGPYCR